MKTVRNFLATTAVGLALMACEAEVTVDNGAASAPVAVTVEDAETFVSGAEAAFEEFALYGAQAAWVQANFITRDTNALAARAAEEGTALAVRIAGEAKRFNGIDLPHDLRRKINLIKLGMTLPAPADAAKTKELAKLTSGLDATYGSGKYCREDGTCLNDRDIIRTMQTSRDPDELLDVWRGWRTISPPMRDDYVRMVEIANEGSVELGYADTGALWRAKYDMPAEEFPAVADALYSEVKPLYDALHCHVQARLSDYYGARAMPDDGTIPAHLLGNVWAQEWGNIYDLVAEGDVSIGYDTEALLKANGYDALKMVKTGEKFFTSIGLDPLPDSFYELSLITKPRDRDVQCHASAWDMSTTDVRIKMCTEVTADDLSTVHHELGHIFYYTNYADKSILYRGGANDGFHEAIGDAIALSITPKYLVDLGLLDAEPDASADIGLLLKQALDKVAFLPFGLMVDQWRWGVFSGEIAPENYNAAWWDLRREYQGISAPVERTEADFDPGAKYHIPGNTPYMRYFLARILQFQFYQAACDAAGHEGPLHRCSFYGNKTVGDKLKAMLAMGQSEPWPEALEAFTGTRDMSGAALNAYFAPLKVWLDEQNEGRSCGWR